MIDKKAYILQNHKFLTVAQMADDLGVGDSWVRYLCDELDVVPISPREQAIAYIKEHINKCKTTAEWAKRLKISTATATDYLRELGISKGKGRPKGSKNAGYAHRTTNKMGKPVFIRDEQMIGYVRDHIDEKTKTEIAEDLHVAFETVERICDLHGIHPTPAKEGDPDYIPPFEQMDNRWHDALFNIFAASFWHDGRDEHQGCPEWEEHKKKMKAIRPKAEYNVSIKSDTLREYLGEQGYHVKK